jgi:very-short-patch-repair endonuclease
MASSSFSSRSRQALLTERAAEMRASPTGTEARLFEALRAGKLGVSFRRQVPVLGRFIADFFTPALRLVVEVDGVYHTGRASADLRRDRALERAGYHVVRLDAELVRRDLEAAVKLVAAEVAALRAAI